MLQIPISCLNHLVQSNTELLIKTSENLILIVGGRRKWLIIYKEYMWSSQYCMVEWD